MARRPRPTLAQVDELVAQVDGLRAQLAAERARADAAVKAAQDFGRRQIQGRRSLEQYVEALHDFNAGRVRLHPDPDQFGGSTGFSPSGLNDTPTPNNPNPRLRWYQRRRGA